VNFRSPDFRRPNASTVWPRRRRRVRWQAGWQDSISFPRRPVFADQPYANGGKTRGWAVSCPLAMNRGTASLSSLKRKPNGSGWTFRRYLEVSGINELARDLRARNICTTARTFSTGKICGGSVRQGRPVLPAAQPVRCKEPLLTPEAILAPLCADNGHLQEREFCRRRPARRKRLRDGSCPRRRKGARKKQREMAVKAAFEPSETLQHNKQPMLVLPLCCCDKRGQTGEQVNSIV
jgi:hypothetical protein